jgi:hypothetical protein
MFEVTKILLEHNKIVGERCVSVTKIVSSWQIFYRNYHLAPQEEQACSARPNKICMLENLGCEEKAWN